MATPTITVRNGTRIHCDRLPNIVPCIAPGLGCWNSSSNCFGLILNGHNHSDSGVIPPQLCNYTICPPGTWDQGYLNYVPSLTGNALYLGIFVVLLAAQIGLSIRWKTWAFLIGMVCGLVLEIVGYIGRIKMYADVFKKENFLIYLVPLTLGPAFLSASIYICLSRIIVLYDISLSRFAPRTYTITFISCDFFSLVLQAIGGGMASQSNTSSELHNGEHIMVAGLSFQVASLFLFMSLSTDFFLAVHRSRSNRFDNVVTTKKFKYFICALLIATICIFIRSIFRVAELSGGFHGPLDNQQITYMVLEGVMVIIASTALTVFHPGPCFAGKWKAAHFFRKSKGKKGILEGNIPSGTELENK